MIRGMIMDNNKIQKNMRKCLACGEVHPMQICPLIQKKMGNYFKQPKRSYLIGNILLRCIQKKVDILQVLCEMAELCENIEESCAEWIENAVPLNLITEYFAVSLNCPESDFFINPCKTSKKFSELLELDYTSNVNIERDENDKVNEIELYMEIPEYTQVIAKCEGKYSGMVTYSFILKKTYIGGEKYSYGLYLKLPTVIWTKYNLPEAVKKFPKGKTYWWTTLTSTSPTEILLIEEDNGDLQRLFEREFDNIWDEDDALDFYSVDDENFDFWMKTINNNINLKQIEWKSHRGNSYYGKNNYNEFILKHNADNEQEYSLYIRLDDGTGICFTCDKNNNRGENPLKTLHHKIENQLNNSQTKVERAEKLEIGIKDFLVRQNMFKCIHSAHGIKNITGIISIIDNDGKKKQEIIPAGYCPQCKTYFIMESTYQKLKKKGHILCRITDEKTYYRTFFVNGTKLAQESILMQYGYNVSQVGGLSDKERQNILAVLIDYEVLSKSEIISYLDFFIRQRSHMSNMETAISKWEEDEEFVEHYRIGEYTKFGVNAIYRR